MATGLYVLHDGSVLVAYLSPVEFERKVGLA